jgi:hypothetical protein
MSKRAQENMIAVLLLGVFAGVIYLCQDFGPRARLIPVPLAIFGIVLTLIQLVWQNFGSTDSLKMDMISVSEPVVADVPQPEPAQEKPVGWRHEAGAFGIVASLLGMVLFLGPYPAVFLFTAGYFVLSRQYSWKAGIAYTVLFTACVYLLFGLALEVQPYHGVLAPLLNR